MSVILDDHSNIFQHDKLAGKNMQCTSRAIKQIFSIALFNLFQCFNIFLQYTISLHVC